MEQNEIVKNKIKEEEKMDNMVSLLL